jgi:hypothetical protein
LKSRFAPEIHNNDIPSLAQTLDHYLVVNRTADLESITAMTAINAPKEWRVPLSFCGIL